MCQMIVFNQCHLKYAHKITFMDIKILVTGVGVCEISATVSLKLSINQHQCR